MNLKDSLTSGCSLTGVALTKCLQQRVFSFVVAVVVALFLVCSPLSLNSLGAIFNQFLCNSAGRNLSLTDL